MEKSLTVLVFSQTNEFKHIYDSMAAMGGFRLVYKEKKMNLSTGLFNEKYDIIIIEILRPAVSEVQFVDFIHNALNQIPIIVVSPYFQDTKNILFGNKVSDYISNPITKERLLESIKANIYGASHGIDLNLEYISDPVEITKKLSVLLEISRIINSKMELDDVLTTITNIIKESFSVKRATVFLAQKNQEDSNFDNISKLNYSSNLPIHKNIVGTVLKTGKSQLINDPENHPNFVALADEKSAFETKNILTIPIKNKSGEIIGVFELLNKLNGTFTTTDEMFLSSVASSAGIAVENAILHKKIKEQLSLARKYSYDLFDSQNKMIFEAKQDVINVFSGFIKNEIHNSKLKQLLLELQKTESKKKVKEIAEKIDISYDYILERIDKFSESIKSSLNK